MTIVCSSQCLQIWYFYIPSRKLNTYDSKVKRFGHALLSYVVCWLDLHVLRVISILRIEFEKSSEQRGRIFLRQALLNRIVLFFKAIWNIFSLGEQRPTEGQINEYCLTLWFHFAIIHIKFLWQYIKVSYL